MNCPHCEAPIPEGATTCQECGRPLETNQNPPSSKTIHTSETAVASLICALLGWSVLPVLGAILAVILGHTAQNEIRDSGGTVGGSELAALGLVLGYANLGIAALAIIVVTLLALLGIAIPILSLGLCGMCALFG